MPKVTTIGPRPRFVGKYDWTSQASAISNVRRAVAEHKPKLMPLIEKIEAGVITDPVRIERIRTGLYAIDSRVMKKWGLGRIFTKDFKYFDRSFINALREAFPKLELDRFGFMIMWGKLSKDEACEAVRFRIGQYRPDIRELLDQPGAKEDLRQKVYELSNLDLIAFGLGALVNGKGVKQFGSRLLRDILPQAFPEIHLNPALFKYQVYKSTYDIENMVRGRIFERYPELKRLYLDTQRMFSLGGKVPPSQIKQMRKIVTGITQAEFLGMGLHTLVSSAKHRRRFNSSYRKILVRSFPLLELKEADFYRTLRWRTREEARQNIRNAYFKHLPGLKSKYLTVSRYPDNGNGGTLRYRIATYILCVSRKKLKKWGVNIDGQGAKKYFSNSFVQALDESFGAIDLQSLRQEYQEKGYDLKATLAVVEYIERYEKLASGDYEVGSEDREFLEYLSSPDFREVVNGIAGKIPKILLIHLSAIRAMKAPRLLKMLSV